MRAHRCSAASGIQWLTRGWNLFTHSPGFWIVSWLVLVIVLLVLNFLPLIGMLLGPLLTPALSGGMLLSARDAEARRPLDLGRLFEPLVDERTRGDILILGLLYLGAYGVAMVAGVVVLVVSVGLSAVNPDLFMAGGGINPAILASVGLGVVFAGLVWLAIVLVVVTLFFYAMPLVALEAVPPVEAIALGTRGLARNAWPLLVTGLIWTVLAILATLPLGLGWLVLGPLTYTIWYASYRDIFGSEPDEPALEMALTGGGSGG